MGERHRIARHFAPLALTESGSFALTDDAALLTPPVGKQLVITTDSVIEGVHVLPRATAQQFAQKLVRRNLSDLAAMGASPWRYTLNLHTPHAMSDSWFAAFAETLMQEQTLFGMVLVGGDSTSAKDAPIHVTLTCFGSIDGAPLRRSGAQVDDDIYVSGTIGDAALGLTMLQQTLAGDPALIARYHVPQPRLALGNALRGVASAAMDISDGLLSDVGQLCAVNGLGAQLRQADIPLSAGVQHLVARNGAFWDRVFNGGDDYELCFAAPPAQQEAIAALATALSLPLTRIGRFTAETSLVVMGTDGELREMRSHGFEHR